MLKKISDIAHADGRPRIQIRLTGGAYEWQHGVGPWGTQPNRAGSAGEALEQALKAIQHQPCVIIYGEVKFARDFERT